MYVPKQMKAPTVRPRSSLSTNEHLHKDLTRRSGTLLTLAGFCVFLFVLCLFLLGALVFVGRTLANQAADKPADSIQLTAANNDIVGVNKQGEQTTESERAPSATKPIRLRATVNQTPSPESTHLSQQTKNLIMASKSKVLQHLTIRLPNAIRPRKYNLRLQPDLENKTFSGSISIGLEVLKPISFIPVHSKFLNVSTEEVQKVSDSNVPQKRIEPSLTYEHKEYEYWVTEFAEPLEIGNYTMRLAFNGSLANRIVGFYQSSYVDAKNKERRWIATSKFEPTYARQAFPCFDEPAMKAMFTITIVRPTGGGYRAISNMDILNEVEMGNVTEVHFAESVPMSTYLACFIVSDFDYETKMVRGTLPGADDFEMRVYATASQVKKVSYALEIGVGITEFYIDYFNISYPLPKLDMAAIPDFVSGAMEHWGLVTFRETALLYDETISSSENKQRVATVVAHELAHMWFGNLVTMKWWNDLWLNEGFASYIEYKGVNHVHPDWNILHHFLLDDLNPVMIFDSTLASHPIVQTVESPSEITELFDQISYGKGASIIRMLEDLVGAEKFRSAVSSYLNNHYFQNAETDDFLSELEALNLNFDVKLIMQTWTEQMGLPVVEVTRSGNTYRLTQKRFFSNPEDYNGNHVESPFNYRWSIPLTYFTSASSEVQHSIFNYNDNEATVTLPSAVDWIKFNKDQVGFYRVNYPEDIWRALTQALVNNRGVFSISDRAHLISDIFALADASQLEYSIALDLTTYLEKELDYVPWSLAAARLSAVKNLLYYTELYRDYVVYVRQLLQQAYESVTWTVGGDHSHNLLRVTVLNAACAYGNKEALQEATTRFNSWLANPAVRPDPDLRNVIYFYGLQETGNEQIWHQVFELFVAEQDAQEKAKLMRALAAVKEPWLLQRYINLAWDETNVRGQDYFTCLTYISYNRVGQSLVWDYVRENWPRLVERFGINERYLGRLIPSITQRFTTQTKLEEMEAFFAKYPEAGAGTAARKQALSTVKYNIKWLAENKAKVGTWLATRSEQKQTRLN